MLQQSGAIAASAAQTSSPHAIAQGNLADAVGRVENCLAQLEEKLAPSLSPAAPQATSSVRAIDDESPIHIVSNLQAWTARLHRASDRLLELNSRCGL